MSLDTVSPVKVRASDGVVYERTGEKRTPEVGELHWCDGLRPAPYPFEWPPATNWEPREDWPPVDFQCEDPDGTITINGEPPRTMSNYLVPVGRPCKNCGNPKGYHVPHTGAIKGVAIGVATNYKCPQAHTCAIWKVSDNQDWEPGPGKTDTLPTLDELIATENVNRQVEGGGVAVLAMLYQAKALERLGDILETVIQHLGGSTPLQTGSVGSGYESFSFSRVCTMCRVNEHAACLNPKINSISIADGFTLAGICGCPTCHQNPTGPSYRNPSSAHIHPFEGMEDNHFCTRCGGGRLHGIHQTQ